MVIELTGETFNGFLDEYLVLLDTSFPYKIEGRLNCKASIISIGRTRILYNKDPDLFIEFRDNAMYQVLESPEEIQNIIDNKIFNEEFEKKLV